MAAISVSIPGRSPYTVTIEPSALDRVGEIVSAAAPAAQCALIADDEVYPLYGQKAAGILAAAGYAVTTSEQLHGEEHKTLETVHKHYQTLLKKNLDRKCPVVSLGGGVVGDTAGFVAATYLRGVPFIQCPTTLLSMVDASVGGKVGVNVPQGKNLIGSFYQPQAVVIDPHVLTTLSSRELRCGLAECIKHAMIRSSLLFEWIGINCQKILGLDLDVLSRLIEENVQIKAAVVVEDEREKGVRAHLNFGHTFAHAIEATCGYGVVRHGEAVALGMIAASRLAAERRLCSPEVCDRLLQLLLKAGLPVAAELPSADVLMRAMMSDKKAVSGKLRFVLPLDIGSVIIVDDVTEKEVLAVWDSIRLA